ncbi:MAG: hypothetical protein IJK87_00510 [Prevotella sp.]|nr:hypothetical protein [Prevotella sp.]
MLEDVAEDVHVDIALEVVGGESAGVFLQHAIGDNQPVKHLVGLEEAAVVGENLGVLALVSLVEVAKELLDAVVERPVFVPLLHLSPPLNDAEHRVGRQQPTVFREEDEEETVEQFLGLLEQQQRPFPPVHALGFHRALIRVLRRHGRQWVVAKDVVEECVLKLRVVTV